MEKLDIPSLLAAVRTNLPTLAQGDPDFEEAFLRAIGNYASGKEVFELPYLLQLARYPVGVEQFLFDTQYLGKKPEEIFPKVLDELCKINNPGGTRVVNPFTEGLFTGGIGSAKSTTALYTVAYQLYVLSCFRNPHRTFGLDEASEILFVFQSLNGEAAKSVDYDRFYSMVKGSPYFKTVFPYDPRIRTRLRFPHRIEIRAIGADHGTIGQNVMGGMIDELNFMAITQQSKKSAEAGVYDQAKTIYDSIARRRKSRFMNRGKAPGILCLVSSKRYPGEFTDRKLEEAKTDPSIYVYDYRVWEVKPPGTFQSGWFNIFIGNMQQAARILEPDEVLPDELKHLVMRIPNDFRKDFEMDMPGALRDVAGVSVLARFPFITNAKAITDAFGKSISIINHEESDLETSVVEFYPARFQNTTQPRWAHVDLGLSSDSCGVAVGHVNKFVLTEENMMMPQISMDLLLRVRPPPNKEIQFYKIRRLLSMLREQGLPIKWVSFDAYQSSDSIQLLRHLGFSTGQVSMDKLNDAAILPYLVTKTALYQGRLLCPPHNHCVLELRSLEQDAKTGKIDHPPTGSKDVSDALAGVVYGLTTRKEIWGMHGVPITQAVSYMKEVKTQAAEKEHVATIGSAADFNNTYA